MLKLLRTFAVFIIAFIATTALMPVVTSPYERFAHVPSFEEETPDRGAATPYATRGSELHRPSQEGCNPMSQTVDHPTDNNQDGPTFEEYQQETRPHIKPGSATYAYEKRIHYQNAVIDKGSVFATLYAGRTAPQWNHPDEELESNLPNNTRWCSETAEVLLRREAGLRFDNGRAVVAHLGLQLRQTPNTREPIVYVNKTALNHEDPSEMTQYQQFQATLDEAVELAPVLLLMVDVARESEQGGA